MFFDFNLYSGLLLIGFIQGIVYAALFLRRTPRLSDRLMASLLIVLCLTLAQWMLGFAGWYNSNDWRTTLMFYFPWYQPLLIGPLLYLYLRSLTNREMTSLQGYRHHLLPALLINLLPLAALVYDLLIFAVFQGRPLPYFNGTRGPIMEFLHNSDHLFLLVITILEHLYLLAYLVWCIVLFRRYQLYLRQHFSNLELRELPWLRNILYAGLLGIGLFLGFIVLNFFFGLDYDETWLGYLALAVGIYILSIQAYHYTAQWNYDLEFHPEQTVVDTAEPVELEAELQEWKTKLSNYMTSQRPYLDPDLNLHDLARQLRTNSNQLSRVINSGYAMNFNDFINSYRTKAFIDRLEAGEHQQRTLLSLALDCGFNSKATFNRAFKKIIGRTPRQHAASLPPRSK